MTSYRIVLSDSSWPTLAMHEMERITSVLGIEAPQVEHVGSTAVPGLGAKPIIDLMVGIRHFSEIRDRQPLLAPLKPLGYEHNGTETVPGTLYLRKAGPPRFNLHMTDFHGSFWEDHLLFRNYLRSHPEVARQYEDLKRGLLAKLGPDPDKKAYSDGKDNFIGEVIAMARLHPNQV